MLRRLVHGIGANIFAQSVVVVLQLSLVSMLALHWGLEKYGVWLLLYTIPAYLQISDFGFAKAAGVDMTMKVALGDRQAATETYQCAWIAVTTLSVSIFMLIATACWLLPDGIFARMGAVDPGDIRLTLILLAAYGMVLLMSSIFIAAFQCDGGYAVSAYCAALTMLLEGVAMITAVLLGGGLVAAATANLTARIIGFIGMGLLSRRLRPWLKLDFSLVDWPGIRRLFAPAVAIMTVPLANALILQGTTVAVGAGAAAAAVPAFNSMRTLSRLGLQMVNIVSRPIIPEFSAASAQGDHRRMVNIVALSLITSVIVTVPLSLVLMVLGTEIVHVWTHGVVEVTLALVIMMTASMVANGIWTPLGNLLMATNRQSLYSYYFLALSFLSIPIAYLLASYLGSTGGGIAMLAVDLIMVVLVCEISWKFLAKPTELVHAMPDLYRKGLRVLGRSRSA